MGWGGWGGGGGVGKMLLEMGEKLGVGGRRVGFKMGGW